MHFKSLHEAPPDSVTVTNWSIGECIKTLIPHFRSGDNDQCGVLSRMEQKLNNLEATALEQSRKLAEIHQRPHTRRRGQRPPDADAAGEADAGLNGDLHDHLRTVLAKLDKIEDKLGRGAQRRQRNQRR